MGEAERRSDACWISQRSTHPPSKSRLHSRALALEEGHCGPRHGGGSIAWGAGEEGSIVAVLQVADVRLLSELFRSVSTKIL